jgi:hypothetical protein
MSLGDKLAGCELFAAKASTPASATAESTLTEAALSKAALALTTLTLTLAALTLTSLALTLTALSLTWLTLALTWLTLALICLTLALASLTLSPLVLTILTGLVAILTGLVATLTLAALALTLTLTTLALALTAVVVVATGAANGEPNAVVLSTTLSDGHKHRLMVTSRGHGADTIVSSGQTFREGGSEFSVTIAIVVDTLEEGKGLGVKRLLRVGVSSEILHGEMRVADDLTALSESLRRSIVGVIGIREGAGLEIGNADSEVDWRVFVNVLAVGGTDYDCRDHLAGGRDVTHGCSGLALKEGRPRRTTYEYRYTIPPEPVYRW